MGSQFVKVFGKKIKVNANGLLYLSLMNIKDISDVKGLDSLSNLKELFLDGNKITEIKGLESLSKLLQPKK